jgi:hypothetical protein
LNCLGVSDLSSLKIPKETLLSSRVLDEELMKFQEKRVFDPTDELQLTLTSQSVSTESDKRLFGKTQKERSKN